MRNLVFLNDNIFSPLSTNTFVHITYPHCAMIRRVGSECRRFHQRGQTMQHTIYFTLSAYINETKTCSVCELAVQGDKGNLEEL